VDLTICLITKGRIEYLEVLLSSLESVFQYDWVKLLVILNGADQNVSNRIMEWGEEKESVIVEFKEENDVRPSILWPLIQRHTDSWCIFISDDDLFNFKVLPFWQEVVSSNKDLVAVSTLAKVIDSKGSETGEIRQSSLSSSLTQIESIAHSLHQPPFSWPTLFFDISKLPDEIPNSRYSFDWWVGIQLILKGRIIHLNEYSIFYRSHSLQESNLSSQKRKNFDTLIWFETILDSNIFKQWIFSLSEQEKRNFWTSCLAKPPIYGDPIYATLILNKLRVLIGQMGSPTDEARLLGEFALINGVLLKDQEIRTLLCDSHNDLSTESNVRVKILEGSCGNSSEIEELFSSPVSTVYSIGCNHSRGGNSAAIIIECEILSNKSANVVADLILVSITERLETSGDINFTLTPKEKKLLKIIRRMRSRLPNPLRNFVRKVLS
jgi:hypothetical protein